MHNKKAFTLIELLVVISIIAVLMSVLLPSLRKARIMAQTVVCGSRLKNVYYAACTFAADNKDKISDNRFRADYNMKDGTVENVWAYNRAWFLMYENYLDSLEIRECPAARPYPKDPYMRFMTSGIGDNPTFIGLYKGMKYENVVLGYTPNAKAYPVYLESQGVYSETESSSVKWSSNDVVNTVGKLASALGKDDPAGIMMWDGGYTASTVNLNPLTLSGRYGMGGIYIGRGYYRHGDLKGALSPDATNAATVYPGGSKCYLNALLGDGHIGKIERRQGYDLLKEGRIIKPSMVK